MQLMRVQRDNSDHVCTNNLRNKNAAILSKVKAIVTRAENVFQITRSHTTNNKCMIFVNCPGHKQS